MLHLFASSPAAHGVQGVSSVQRQQTGLLDHEPALCDPVGHDLLQAEGRVSPTVHQVATVRGSKAGLRVGTAFFQTCFCWPPSGRAAPEPALPFPRLSYSGAACLVPDDPGRSRTPVPLLVTNKQPSHRVNLILRFCLNNKKRLFITL